MIVATSGLYILVISHIANLLVIALRTMSRFDEIEPDGPLTCYDLVFADFDLTEDPRSPKGSRGRLLLFKVGLG